MKPEVGRGVIYSTPDETIRARILNYAISERIDRKFERFLLNAEEIFRNGSSFNLIEEGCLFVFLYERPMRRDKFFYGRFKGIDKKGFKLFFE
jgi:hypothetical protein